jgi:nucleoid-associated protein YgaU
MSSAGSALKLTAVVFAAVTVAAGCATSKKGEMAEAAAASAAPAAAEAMAMASDQYTVKQNDNLWDISGMQEIYGNSFDWPIIYSHNRAQIKDADLIYAGQVFNIPREFAPREVSNARAHARNRGAWSLGATEASDTAFLAANPQN